MAIVALDLRTAMAAVLGTAGTQRYLDDQHYIPAIQAAQRRFNGLVGSVFAENKGSEEMFRDITEVRVFQTNELGGITLLASQLGHKVWSIAGVYPEPTTTPNSDIAPIPPNLSQWRQDLTMQKPGKYGCERMTLEQAAIAQDNQYMSGNETLAAGPRRSYGYYIMNRTSDSWLPGDVEFVVTPESICGRKLMVVAYLKGVDPIVSLAETIPYPESAFQILRDLALNEISIRQGTTPLFNVSLAEVRALLVAQA